jgi:transcription initiation factor TFIIA small subunit
MLFFQYGQITPGLAVKVLLQFDKAINQALATRVKSRLSFRVKNSWMFII